MNEQARAILDENVLGVLATVNEDGSPWATPLHFVADEKALYWFSSDDRIHSANSMRDGRASVVLFSPDTSQGLSAVYVRGVVGRVDMSDHERVLELFRQRLGSVPPPFATWGAYSLPLGVLDEQKSTGNCWYFYS